MGDIAIVPNGMMLSVKEESPAETGVSDVPVFTGTRESAQSTPASTFTQDSQGLKPEGDDAAVPPSAAAATIASGTILSDGMPATPYSLHSLPATPPPYFDTVEFDADKSMSTGTVGPQVLNQVNQLLNDTPSDSASEPHSEPQVRPRRMRHEFVPARRSPPRLDGESESPEPCMSRITVLNGHNEPAGGVQASETAAAPRTAHSSDSMSANDEDAAANAASSLAFSPASPKPPQVTEHATAPALSTPSSGQAEDTIASRRPMRMARQPKVVVQEVPKPTRSSPRSATRAASKLASSTPTATPSKTSSNLSRKSKAKPLAFPKVERRATRLSGLPSELLAPKPTALGKRRRSESDKNLVAEIPRELRRLQDTIEFSHVDVQPVIHTVWSNGKYVPANAAGEPLPDKTKRAGTTKKTDAQAGKDNAESTPSAVVEEAAIDPSQPVQKRVKKWLNKGLYAGQSMPENPNVGLTASEKKQLAKLPELSKKYPPNKTLPMPIYNGMRMLIQGRDFKMPFDVFNPLPPGQPKPVKYGRFSKNRFVGEALAIWKKSPSYDDFQSKCVCKPETGCDDDCQNRIMLYECNDMICNVGSERCSNREFQQLAERTASKNPFNIGVEVFKTPNRGHGIRANRGFRPGQIIMEYIGEIITEEESDRRMNELYKDNECYYLMSFDQSLIIDGTSGSIARFVNHSCSPNCRMIKWIVSGQPRIALFAGDRPIQTGEELTYDYNFDPYSAKNVQGCLCGSENCRGILGPRKSEKAVSKAAAEKAAAEKAKSNSKDKGVSHNKSANNSGKRKHDVYSMDEDIESSRSGPATKKMRTGSGQPPKGPPSRPVTTTKAALEALAAKAAKEARLAKATKAAKAARAARAAKAAEATKAAEAAKKAKLAKLSKASKAAKATKSGKSAKPAKETTANKSGKSSATSKSTRTADATKAVANKATKSVKAVKAAKSVTVVKTAKGLKASRASKGSKTTKETKTASKDSKTTKSSARKAPAPSTKSTKATAQVAKPARSAKPARTQKPKASLAQRAVTPPAPIIAASEATPQATPMAQAVAKAAKEAARVAQSVKPDQAAKSHGAVKFIKRSQPQSKAHLKTPPMQTKTAPISEAPSVSEEGLSPTRKGKGRPRQVPKKIATTAFETPTSKQATEPTVRSTTKALTVLTTPDAPNEEDELAAQLYMDSTPLATPKVAANARSRVFVQRIKQGKVSKPTIIRSVPPQQLKNRLASEPARRGPGRPRRSAAVEAPNELTAAAESARSSSDDMLIDEPVDAIFAVRESPEDVIHVASRSGRQD